MPAHNPPMPRPPHGAALPDPALPLPPSPRCALRGAPLLPRYDWADAPVVQAALGLPDPLPLDTAPPSLSTDLVDTACWLVSAAALLGLLLAVAQGGLA